ncbi:MAG: glycosyltransferase, partial [Flavobacteriales bacterium]|nr:glycosyltransferase [Flavobacteriales bacterium]
MKSPESVDILIFTDWYLPGYKAGGPIVSIANMVEALSPHRRIAVVCSDRDYLDTASYPDITADFWQRHGTVSVFYLSPGQSSYSRVADLIRSINPKMLYINGMFSKVFSVYPLLAARRGSQRIILAPRGMLAPGALGVKPLRKHLFLALAKMWGLYRHIELHATHEHEAGHIRKILGSKVPVKVLPNLPSLPENELKPAVKTDGRLRVLTVARMAREKNLHFALECLVKAAETHRVSLIHIGPVYDEGYAARCREIAEKGGLEVTWEGAVPPADIQKRYGAAHLFFLPSLG